MQFRIPKNTEKYQWTKHSIEKMKHYGLSAQRVLRVLRSPQRKEEGIVPKTIAVMQPASTRFVRSSSKRGGPTSVSTKNGKRIWTSEIWAMYQTRRAGISNSKFKILNSANPKIRIISAWRYPGVSPKRNPIPEEILQEMEKLA